MDVVVRTPHGDADITIVTAAATVTLRDVVEFVTGQAVPAVIELDGHPLDASTPVRDAPMVIGSTLATQPLPFPPNGHDDVNLLQLAGRGAGAIRRLAVGRYRIGPGRRLATAELDDAPVEAPMFEMVVEPTTVTICPIDEATDVVTLAGAVVDKPTQWTTGELTVARRIFALEIPATAPLARRLAPTNLDGTVPFSRSPQTARGERRLLAVDAVRSATRAGAGLWSRRPAQTRSYEIPFGIVDDQSSGATSRVVSVDLGADGALGVVGSDSFRAALVRTLIVEATTLHGPVDLDVVVATGSDRLADWDWAKWLPHARLDSTPALFSSDAELTKWADSAFANSQWITPHLTMLVIDDPALWTRRDSPVRHLLAAPPAGLRIIALCDDFELAPALCSSVIEQTDDGLAQLTLLTRGRVVSQIVPALIGLATATSVARSMAPLNDSELPPRRVEDAGVSSSQSLVDGLGLRGAGPSVIRRRWSDFVGSSDATITIPVGTTATGDGVEFAWSTGETVSISGPTDTDVAMATSSLLHAFAATVAPRSMPLLHLTHSDTSALADVIKQLPHAAGRCNMADATEVDRVLARVDQVLQDGRAVVVLIEALGGESTPVDLVERLHAMRRPSADLRLILVSATDPTPGITEASIVIDRRAGHLHGILRRRSIGQSEAAGNQTEASFSPFDSRAAQTDVVMEIKPLVYGRALTPLERRLVVPGGSGRSFELDQPTAELAATISAASLEEGAAPTLLVPPPLPSTVDLGSLLAEYQGDAAPFGRLDVPSRAEISVAWWQPGAKGSLLLVGSPRSGVDAALSALIVGVSERFSPDDLAVYAIDPMPRRLTAFESLPHTAGVASPDRLDDAQVILELLATEVITRRAESHPTTRVAKVLFVHDLGQLERRLLAANLRQRVDHVRTIAGGGDVGVNIVATATRPSDSMGVIDVVADVIVGQMSNPSDRIELGVSDGIAERLGAQRCWSTAAGAEMQLAVARESLTEMLPHQLGRPGDSNE